MSPDIDKRWKDVASLLEEASSALPIENSRIIELWGYGNNPGFPGDLLDHELSIAPPILHEQIAAYERVMGPMEDAEESMPKITEYEWMDLLQQRREPPHYFDDENVRDRESLQIDDKPMLLIESALRLSVSIALDDDQCIEIRNPSDSGAYNSSLVGEYLSVDLADESRKEQVLNAYVIQAHEYAVTVEDMPDPVGQLSEIATLAENCGLLPDDPVFRAMIAFGERVQLRLATLKPVTALAAPQLYKE